MVSRVLWMMRNRWNGSDQVDHRSIRDELEEEEEEVQREQEGQRETSEEPSSMEVREWIHWNRQQHCIVGKRKEIILVSPPPHVNPAN